MKKTKKRHPKTHAKTKQRERKTGEAKRSAPVLPYREVLTKYLVEKSPEAAPLMVEMLSRMSDAQLEKMFRAASKVGSDEWPSEAFENDDFEDDEPDFDRFIDLCRSEEDDAGAQIQEIAPALSAHMKALKVRSEFGDPDLLREIEDIRGLVAEAIEDEELPRPRLLVIAKVLADAAWPVPDALKQAVAGSLETGAGIEDDAEAFKRSFVSSILTLSKFSKHDEFELYQGIASTLEAFPTDLAAELAGLLAESVQGVMGRAMIGFALHREAAVAAAALGALAAANEPVETLVVERLERLRPWTAPERYSRIDATIQALRANAKPSAKPEWSKVEKVFATTCDATGAQNLLVQVREKESFKTLAVLIGPEGVVEIMAFEDRTRGESLERLRSLKGQTDMVEVEPAVVARLLSLALADGLAKGASPGYRLAQFVELVEIGPLTPHAETAAEIAEACLAGLPAAATDETALARAYAAVAEAHVSAKWLVANATLAQFFADGGAERDGVEIALTSLPPERKAFWARVCAMSALTLRGPERRPPSRLSVALALVARDLCSDKPVEDLPLLRHIAETTARVFLEVGEAG